MAPTAAFAKTDSRGEGRGSTGNAATSGLGVPLTGAVKCPHDAEADAVNTAHRG